MKIVLINASNIKAGGALQVASSFLVELNAMGCNLAFHVFASQEVLDAISSVQFNNKFSFILIEASPAKLQTRHSIQSLMSFHESKIKPDVVFSVFGPSYWRPKQPHLVGVADGWIYYQNSIAYSKLNWKGKIKRRLLNLYKKYYFNRDSDAFVLETHDAASRFSRLLHAFPEQNFHVVSNSFNSFFDDFKSLSDEVKRSRAAHLNLPDKELNEFRFCYIAHGHPNKNVEILNDVVPLLEGYNIKFILTLDHSYFNRKIRCSNSVINIGPIKPSQCPELYYSCDALFFPSLLETFSASYPEAMTMNKPILTSDLSFARDICKDAALYFNPLSAQDIAGKIIFMSKNLGLMHSLVRNGEHRVDCFPTARERATLYLDILDELYTEQRKVRNV